MQLIDCFEMKLLLSSLPSIIIVWICKHGKVAYFISILERKFKKKTIKKTSLKINGMQNKIKDIMIIIIDFIF